MFEKVKFFIRFKFQIVCMKIVDSQPIGSSYLFGIIQTIH